MKFYSYFLDFTFFQGAPTKYRRHMSLTSVEGQDQQKQLPCMTASMTALPHGQTTPSLGGSTVDVLKKLSSTSTTCLFGQEWHIVKPTFVPEKLDFKLYEKFEGEHTICLLNK